MGNVISDIPKLFETHSFYIKPWRTLPTSTRDDLLAFMRNYQPRHSDVQHIRILLYGPIGAGKSSFINSVNSVLQGRISRVKAPVDKAHSSYTHEYKTYKISKGNGSFYSFAFNDTMGFEKDNGKGVLVEDFKLALGGHVQENYEFKTDMSVRGDGYRDNPTLQDKVHVLVCVVPADTMDLKSDEVWKKLRQVRLEADKMGIPQIAVITKVDQRPYMKGNITKVHRSKDLEAQVDQVHDKLGIPPYCIFLVKNYHEETSINDSTDHLILTALEHMIRFGEEYLNDIQTNGL